MSNPRRRADLIEQLRKPHGHLVLISAEGWPRCLFRCSCGTEKAIFYDNVVRGYSTSCGCGTGLGIDRDGQRCCTDCKQWRDLSEFPPHRAHRGGRRRRCAACESAAAKRARKRRTAAYVPAAPTAKKKCGRCGQVKLAGAFRPRKTATDGLRCYCKDCESANVRQQKYGISAEGFLMLWDAQAGRCRICERALSEVGKRQIHIDHDHETGRVRGILCYNCNAGLGYFRDDRRLLRRAMAYLRLHKEPVRPAPAESTTSEPPGQVLQLPLRHLKALP